MSKKEEESKQNLKELIAKETIKPIEELYQM